MGSTAILAVRIIGDAKNAVRAMGQVDTSAGGMERMLRAASVAAGLLFAALIGLGVQATDVASDLQQATGAVDSVFKEYADGVHEFAATAAQDVGLAKDQYSQLASVLGSQLKNLGIPLDETGAKTSDLIELGADLSAMYGGTAADAVAALSSLLRGERDPIERYGVSIKQADINARLGAQGLLELTGEARKNAELQATLAILTEQTADAHGTFARESDTASGAQQRANAAWRDAQGALGVAFLPLVVEGATALSEFAGWVEENQELALALGIGLGILAGSVLVLTAAQWAFNIAAAANPVGIVILLVAAAIGLLIALVLVIIDNWEQVEAGGKAAFTEVGYFMNEASHNVEDFINLLIDAVNWLVKIGTGQFLSDGLGDLLGFESAQYAPQIEHVKFAPTSDRDAGRQTTTNVTNNITVNGAVDSAGTARTVNRALTKSGRIGGTLPAAGAPA